MQFQIVDKKLKDIKADIELIFVVDKDLKHKFISDKEAIKFNNFKGNMSGSHRLFNKDLLLLRILVHKPAVY